MAIEQAVQGEEGLRPGRVELGQVDESRTSQRPRDVAVLPAALGAALAVPVELHRSDQRDVTHLPRQRDAVVGRAEEGRELLQVVILAGAHVASQSQVERDAVEILAANGLQSGQPIQHSQVDVVRIRLRDMGNPKVVVRKVRGDVDRLELDRLALAAGVLERDPFRHTHSSCRG